MKDLEVVGAAIRDGAKILAAQRSAQMKTPLKWEFVGGKVEKNETHEDALKREVYEELGLNIDVQGFLAVGYSVMGDKRVVLSVYEARIISGTIKVKEHSQIRWIEVKDINKLDWAEADIPACKKLLEKSGINK